MKNIKTLFLRSIIGVVSTHCLYAGFFLPDDKQTADFPQKTSRNAIFSSVNNNTESEPRADKPAIINLPVPIDKPVVSAMDFSNAVSDSIDDIKTGSPGYSSAKATSHEQARVSVQALAKSEGRGGEENISPVAVPTIAESDGRVIATKAAVQEQSAMIANETSMKKINNHIAEKQVPKKVEQDPVEKLIEEKINQKEPGVLYQNKHDVQDSATIAFNFEEASLANLVSYIETVHNVTFIHDEIITPAAKDAKGYSGHKITFRTNKNLTRKESWDLFITFLNIAGLDVVPLVQEGFYRIVPLARANTETIPTFIGVDADVLPDNDMIVRYVYFAKNIDPAKIKPVLAPMQGGSGKLDLFTQLKALIFTDRSSSIKSLMQIVTELDRSVLPEVLSVVKLKRTTAKDVKSLYESLKPGAATAGQPAKVWAPGKKESSLEYFPQDVTLINDDRTNSLILLGTAKDVKRVEDFVVKHIDIELERKSPPIFTYTLQYTNASDIAVLLNKIVTYGTTTSVGQYGGVLGGIKFFQKMTITNDSHSNSLVINAVEQDFLALKPLIEELDQPQKQVGLEVLIVQVKDIDTKTLGAQISGPNGAGAVAPGASPLGPTFLPSVTAQTSGIPLGTPIVTTVGNPATEDFSIKSSLSLLLGSAVLNEVGSTLITFGRPIWAIFKILKTMASSHIIANPFVVVSNNSTAEIKSGEERRQVSGQVVSQGNLSTTGFAPVEATLDVQITPLINKGNIINLAIKVSNRTFTQPQTVNDLSPVDEKTVSTTASVANGETLVLGGIMTETYTSTSNGVPFLENIPVFGWFFKSKTRQISRNHFLIFISPRIIDPVGDSNDVDEYTDYKLREAQKSIDLIDESDWFGNSKDPIQRAFFGKTGLRVLQEFNTAGVFEKRREIEDRVNNVPTVQEEQMLMHRDVEQPVKQKKVVKQKKIVKKKKRKSKIVPQQESAQVVFDIEPIQAEDVVAPPLRNTIQAGIQQGKG
ncbi:MAG TPA: secretin N-terminal domain-containing protein [Candidatus Saccharimonadales bacterium]|nr:secretin N-terminal domain-containing protein [Candidatus Saccharimonadales bacterium]